MPARQRFLVFSLATAVLFFLSPRVVFSQVVINELLPNPADGVDWVELYNTTDQDVDLDGWVLDDEAATNMLEIKEATVSAYGFLVFEVGNRLNKNKDTICLINDQGSTIDEYQYTANPGTGISFGRMPDGGDWGICSQPTAGAANQCLVPTPTPTPTQSPDSPTASPTPEPTTPTPTSPPSPTPTPKRKVIKTPTPTPGEILGEEESSPAGFYAWEATEEAEVTAEAESSGRLRWLVIFLFGTGLVLLFAAAVWLWYTQLK